MRRNDPATRISAAKLTAEQVTEIRKAASQGVKTTVLAARYLVCSNTISKIINRRTWTHLADPA